ncbi:ferrous iron transport protein A [Thalassotalea litorea]|uniref:Ferrous iron transport protein A n=1 Tax=Thalassotalea litorea TaxID=2020715 RepID=A0A5R9IF01_9GAMM|nr:FeoA family protein [Thalassotalea litorea]TLU64105.1 ferrous iron transport protein A [Thalassotalea litorea]
MTLNQVKAGEKAIISGFSRQPSVRAKLMDLGLIPGTAITMKRSLGWSKAMQIHVRQANLIIRQSLAEDIQVKVVK